MHSIPYLISMTTTPEHMIYLMIYAGGMMGGTMVGLVSSYCGRKGGLLLNNILAIIGAALMAASKVVHVD